MQSRIPRTSTLLFLTVTGCAIGWLAAATAHATPIQINATENSAQPGFFTLDFGAQVGITSGQITSTDYGLEVDPEAGTARLTAYYQEVGSLNLFGVPTGDITVEVVEGSSSGAYNPLTREFTTSETYRVHFTGDLSSFGLFSPVELPSTSTGIVEISTQTGASHVNLQWDGVTDVIPGQEFSYTCVVNTAFTSGVTQILNVGLRSATLDLNMTYGLTEDQLLDPLNMASLRFQEGNLSSTARNLEVFVDELTLLVANRVIPSSVADPILGDAEFLIDKLTFYRRLRLRQ